MHYAAGSAIDRTLRLVRFDANALRSLVRDPNSTAQAAVVIGIVSLAIAVGSVEDSWVRFPLLILIGITAWSLVHGSGNGVTRLLSEDRVDFDAKALYQRFVQHVQASIPAPASVIGIAAAIGLLAVVLHIPALLVPVVAWFTFTGLAWFACNELAGHPGTQVQFVPLLRAIGFSFAPVTLAMFAAIPVLGALMVALAIGWTLLLITFSIKHLARLETQRAALTALIASAGTLVVTGILTLILNV